MLTIALDENGDFEGLKKEKEPIFIAGLLYQDFGHEGETEMERKRIEKYYEKACQSANTKYPEDLHVNHEGSNMKQVGKTKQEINQTLGEFLRMGTYGKKPLLSSKRQGRYTLFLYLKSGSGKSSLLVNNICDLINDKIASNLYTHMAEEVVSRLLFHNPYEKDIHHVSIDLPTRLAVLEGDSLSKYEEYKKLGYKDYHPTGDKTGKEIHDGKKYLQIANDSTYRGAIARELLTTGKYTIKLDRLSVGSIKYWSNASKKMGFLYLADSICSLLNREKIGENPAEWLESFWKQAKELTGSQRNLFFAYDSIDLYFDYAWKALEKKDYFEAWSQIYHARQKPSSFKNFYEEHWFSLLEQEIETSAEKDALEIAIQKMNQYAHIDNQNQGFFLYLFERLQSVMQNQQEHVINKETEFKLYNAGISVFNHIGKPDKADACFQKCRTLARHAHIEDYLRALSKQAVQKMDRYQTEEAREITEEAIAYEKELSTLKQLLYQDETDNFKSYAISLSQCGQVYAAMQDKKAEEYFKEALSHFEKNSNDYFITMSYLLHHYISQKEKDSYDRYAAEYFGGNTEPLQQFDYLMKEGTKEHPLFTLKFAFFVFLKGTFCLHRADISRELRLKLLEIEKTFKQYGAAKEINGHPWELIYKYLAFLALQQGKETLAHDYMAKAETIVQNQGPVIDNIVLKGKWQFAQRSGQTEKCQEYIEQIAENTRNLAGDTSEYSEKELLDKINYMYD